MPTPLDMPPERLPIPEPRSVEDLRLVAHAVAAAMDRAVRLLRLSGASWTEVGTRLGVSRQAATKKYGHLDAAPVALVRGPDGRAFFRCTLTGHEFRDARRLALYAVGDLDRARTLDHARPVPAIAP